MSTTQVFQDENSNQFKTAAFDSGNLTPVTASDMYEKFSIGPNGHRVFPSLGSLREMAKTRVAEGTVTWSGGLATLVVSLTGVEATDYIYAEVINTPTEAVKLVSAVPGTDEFTITLSGANTSNDAVVNYWIYRV